MLLVQAYGYVFGLPTDTVPLQEPPTGPSVRAGDRGCRGTQDVRARGYGDQGRGCLGIGYPDVEDRRKPGDRGGDVRNMV